MNQSDKKAISFVWFLTISGFFATLLIIGVDSDYIEVEYKIAEGGIASLFLGLALIELIGYVNLKSTQHINTNEMQK